jgi:sigma-B regulation protein RsbU (phosphoserine phosphatase)
MADDPPTEELEDLYEHAPCGYLSADAQGRIVKVNRTFLDWTGHAAGNILGKRIPDLFNVAGRIFFETHFAPLLRMQGYFHEVALDLVKADGTRLAVLANASERRDPEGRLRFTRLVVMQATQRRRHERELSTALANEKEVATLREQFIAVLGHDLRNPIAAITSGIRLLGPEVRTDKGFRLLALMQASTIRMTGLIDNLLDFARGRLGGGLTVDPDPERPLEPTLRQVVEELRIGNVDRVIDEHYDIARPVPVDHVRIAQLFSNLLANALTHGSDQAPVRVDVTTGGGELAVSVANAGVPIAPPDMARLFQPFARGEVRHSKEGLGLGLHIASEIAKAHGGLITVASDAEETRFTFRMPLPSRAE